MVLSNGTLLANKSGSIKECTQTIHNYVLQGRAGSDHAYIRQLANVVDTGLASFCRWIENYYKRFFPWKKLPWQKVFAGCRQKLFLPLVGKIKSIFATFENDIEIVICVGLRITKSIIQT